MGISAFWRSTTMLPVVWVLCFLIVGIPLWRISYSDLTVPNAFFGLGILVVFASAALFAFRFGFGKGVLMPGLLFPAALMSRVLVEGFLEPTRHNLWPLALIIAAVLGFAVAGAGSVVGRLAARLSGKGYPHDSSILPLKK